MCELHDWDLPHFLRRHPLTFRVVVLILDVHILFLDLFVTVLESIICMDSGDVCKSRCRAGADSTYLYLGLHYSPSMSSSDILVCELDSTQTTIQGL